MTTPIDLDASLPLYDPECLKYSFEGDGLVPVNSAVAPNTEVLTVDYVAHQDLPVNQRCWRTVLYFLQQLTGPA